MNVLDRKPVIEEKVLVSMKPVSWNLLQPSITSVVDKGMRKLDRDRAGPRNIVEWDSHSLVRFYGIQLQFSAACRIVFGFTILTMAA